jgi:hypothetical protein
MRKLLLRTALALLAGQAALATPVLFLKTGTTTMEVTGSAERTRSGGHPGPFDGVQGARDSVTVTYSKINSTGVTLGWVTFSNGAAKPEPFGHGAQMKTITRSNIYLPMAALILWSRPSARELASISENSHSPNRLR